MVDTDFNQAAGARVRQLRSAAGLSQTDLASQLGLPHVSQTVLSAIETGERPIRLEEAIALARALGVMITKLVAGDDPRREAIQQQREDALATIAAYREDIVALDEQIMAMERRKADLYETIHQNQLIVKAAERRLADQDVEEDEGFEEVS
jgi:transcriptional regulator with XRE-family HTH domain